MYIGVINGLPCRGPSWYGSFMKRTRMKLLKGRLPLLLLSVWVSGVGWFYWVKAHESLYPPTDDPVSYMMKAKNSWENACKGFPVNPLDVELSLRPPGTVLISFPFGYDGDYKAFHFRTVFIPFLIWTMAVLMVCWPIGSGGRIADRWLAAWMAMLFGAHPFLMQIEKGPLSIVAWGFMDQALGACAGFAMAAVARSLLTRSRLLLASGVLMACFSLLIKPAGSMVLLFTAGLFTLSETLRILLRKRASKPLDLGFPFLGLLLFAILGGGLSLLCLSSKYISRDNIDFMQGAVRYLLILEKNLDKWKLRGNLYVFLGVQGALLLCWVALLPFWKRVQGHRASKGLDILMGMTILAFGYWMLDTRMGLSQTRYFSPFAFMATSLFLGAVMTGLRERHFSEKTLKILVIPSLGIGTAVILSTLVCLVERSPSTGLQTVLGTALEISDVENDGMRIGRWLNESYGDGSVQTAVYTMLDSYSREDGSFYAIRGYGRPLWSPANTERKGYRIVESISWVGEPAISLMDLVWKSDLILLSTDTASRPRFTGPSEGYAHDGMLLRFFLNDLAVQGRMHTIHREGRIRVLRIPDKDRFLEIFDSAFSHQPWSSAFIRKNRIEGGRVHLFDTLASIAPLPFGGMAGPLADGVLEAVNGFPADGDTLTSGRFLKVSGWLAADPRKGLPAEDIFLTLESDEGDLLLSKTNRMKRPDLVNRFGHSSLFRSGFEIELDLRHLHGLYTLGLAYVKDGKWYRLPGTARTIIVKSR